MKKLKLNGIILTILSLVILFFVLKDDFNGSIKVLLRSNIWYIILIILALIVAEIFKSFSLFIIIKKIKPNYTILNAFALTLKTEFFNGITPFAMGGQPYQLYSLKNKDNIDYASGVNILFKDYLAYQSAFLSLGTIVIIINYIFKLVFVPNIIMKFVLVGYFINTIIVTFLFSISYKKGENNKIIYKIIDFLNKIRIIKDKEQTKDKIYNVIHRIRTQIRENNKKQFLKCYIFNTLKLLMLGLVGFLCFKATYVNSVNLINSIIIIILTMTLSTFVPIPGGTGGMEYGFINLFSNFVLGAKLNATAVLWRFTGFHILIISGALIYIFEERLRKKLEVNNG